MIGVYFVSILLVCFIALFVEVNASLLKFGARRD
jgi:hypothetical protein